MRSSAPPSFSTVAAAALADRHAAPSDLASHSPSRAVRVSSSATRSAPLAAVERLVDLGEIPNMRAMQHGGAEPDRLDRVLAAMAGQRAAHEHDRREPVDQAEFAERVGDIDIDICASAERRASAARPQAGGAGDLGDVLAARRMPRRDHGQQRGKFRAQPADGRERIAVSSPGWVEAAAMTGRVPMSALKRVKVV